MAHWGECRSCAVASSKDEKAWKVEQSTLSPGLHAAAGITAEMWDVLDPCEAMDLFRKSQ